MRAIILGCGTSAGAPHVGPDWGNCDPNNPKNLRTRGSIIVEHEGTRVLVDTSPDLRQQLLSNHIDHIDAVLWTHDHADQSHGIDDIRFLAYRVRKRIDGYADEFTMERLNRKFGYCFKGDKGYPPILKPHIITGPLTVGALDIVPFEQDHGEIKSLGFRFGDFGYSNDVVGLSDDAFEALAGVKVWVVDALRYAPHPSHSHLEQTLEWIKRLKPERAILTNMRIDLDYDRLCRELPQGIEPAFDGMVIDV